MTPSGYQIHASTGRDAFGNYRATRADGAHVVLKVLGPDTVGALDIDHLRKTVDALQQFQHHAIAGHNALIDFRGDLVLTSEWVDGIDVGTLVQVSPMPARVAVLVAAEVAGALLAAHEAKDSSGEKLSLQHGDLKPGCMIMSADGDVVLTDFGLSRVRDQFRDQTLTMFVESQGFFPPERLDGQDSVAADVYALALIVAYMVTGETPSRTSAHPKRHAQRREQTIEGMKAVLSDDQHALVELVEGALHYDPEQRTSMGEFARACAKMSESFKGPMPGVWAEPLVQVLRMADPEVAIQDDGERLSSSVPLADLHRDAATISPPPLAIRRATTEEVLPAQRPARYGWLVGAVLGVGIMAAAVIAASVALLLLT